MAGLKTYWGMRVKISAALNTLTCASCRHQGSARIGPPFIRPARRPYKPAPARQTGSMPGEKDSPSRSGGATGAGLTASTPMSGASTMAMTGPNTPHPTTSSTAAMSTLPRLGHDLGAEPNRLPVPVEDAAPEVFRRVRKTAATGATVSHGLRIVR